MMHVRHAVLTCALLGTYALGKRFDPVEAPEPMSPPPAVSSNSAKAHRAVRRADNTSTQLQGQQNTTALLKGANFAASIEDAYFIGSWNDVVQDQNGGCGSVLSEKCCKACEEVCPGSCDDGGDCSCNYRGETIQMYAIAPVGQAPIMLVPQERAASAKGALTVVISNYKRPHNLEVAVPELLKYAEVREVMIINGDRDNTYSGPADPKMTYIDNFDQPEYTLSRFKFAASAAKSEVVTFLDDDLLPTRSLLRSLVQCNRASPRALCGTWVRSCTGSGYRWASEIGPSPPNVMLPGSGLTVSKDVVRAVYAQMKRTYRPLFDKVVSNHGNGEDLLFNYVYQQITPGGEARLAQAVGGGESTAKLITLDGSNGFSQDAGGEVVSAHKELRSEFCKELAAFKFGRPRLPDSPSAVAARGIVTEKVHS